MNKSHEEIQSFLANHNLCSFSHRVFIRLDLFIFKIIKSSKPPILNEYMIVNSSDTLANRLKSKCYHNETILYSSLHEWISL